MRSDFLGGAGRITAETRRHGEGIDCLEPVAPSRAHFYSDARDCHPEVLRRIQPSKRSAPDPSEYLRMTILAPSRTMKPNRLHLPISHPKTNPLSVPPCLRVSVVIPHPH